MELKNIINETRETIMEKRGFSNHQIQRVARSETKNMCYQCHVVPAQNNGMCYNCEEYY
jgi:predicted nucleic acid-binding protein